MFLVIISLIRFENTCHCAILIGISVFGESKILNKSRNWKSMAHQYYYLLILFKNTFHYFSYSISQISLMFIIKFKHFALIHFLKLILTEFNHKLLLKFIYELKFICCIFILLILFNLLWYPEIWKRITFGKVLLWLYLR